MNTWTLDPLEEGEPDHDETGFEAYDDAELDDRFGSIEVRDEGNELVLTRTGRSSKLESTEMLRFDRVEKLLRVFPKVNRSGQFEDQFDRIIELQVEAPAWDPHLHSAVSERYDLLHAVGLPAGFAATYEYGLGIKRDYRDFVGGIEKHSSCTILRFTNTGREGLDAEGETFWVSLQRFGRYCDAVERNRGRGRTAVRRVNDAECHNAVADLFELGQVEPRYGKNQVIRALTEEVSTGYVVDAADRVVLVDEVERTAPEVAREAPERFARLRTDIELVSLEVLIEQFEEGLKGPHNNDESYWQSFFGTNRFALQQLFSMPIVVACAQAHVQAADVSGRGARITDFLCANTVTHSAVVVEIKAPATALMAKTSYRGKGTAEVYPPDTSLSGSIAQVQSQMAAVSQDLARRLDRSPELKIDAWNDVRGAVIAGRLFNLTDEQRESFLRYRAGLTTVTVLGYDEVLERLKALLTVLKSPPDLDGDTMAGADKS
ncbi:hypothetical protein GCM10025781_26960 [Kocuria gwangalliensis]|uniref:Shedu protein SduA C-terminal domain-containing protein n=1 Tax=Kocuria gwangalliensis TaxID=501592 RepID=A0ABP8XHD4_9MICC